MGEQIKILDLAKRMASLSALRPVLNPSTELKENEIAITVSGLRPGEKLFEELSYSPNLRETIHPRIKTTDETFMKYDELRAILSSIHHAIRDGDHQELYRTIAKVTDGVPDLAASNDIFISHH